MPALVLTVILTATFMIIGFLIILWRIETQLRTVREKLDLFTSNTEGTMKTLSSKGKIKRFSFLLQRFSFNSIYR